MPKASIVAENSACACALKGIKGARTRSLPSASLLARTVMSRQRQRRTVSAEAAAALLLLLLLLADTLSALLAALLA